MIEALNEIVLHIEDYKNDYRYDNHTNMFWHKNEKIDGELINRWFSV